MALGSKTSASPRRPSIARDRPRDLTVVRLVMGLLALGLLICAAWFDPTQIAAGEHLSWTGLVTEKCPGCPLCGLSRGFAFALRGEFTIASKLNLAFWPFFLTAVAGAVQVPLALRMLIFKK
ncbi:MAG TPA: DUF2752 domain-containing protein [Planctomycetes bacterium]|nr:DUF2752 domain-containing protein [Planctomycetota bacterium]